MEEITFGDFSDKEVKDLFSCHSDNKLEFGWQKQMQKVTHGDDVSLRTPEKQKYLLGALSPNIPPNPPTSPVDGIDSLCDRTKSPSKLNVNAMPFVPSTVSIIVAPKNSTLTQSKVVSRKLYVGTTDSVNKGKVEASVDERIQERGTEIVCNQDSVASSKESMDHDDVQTVGQHTSNCSVLASHGGQSQSEPRDLTPVMSQSDSSTSGIYSDSVVINSVQENSPVVTSNTCLLNNPQSVTSLPSSPIGVTGSHTPTTPPDSRPSNGDSVASNSGTRSNSDSSLHSVTTTLPHTAQPSSPPHTLTSTSSSVTSPTTSQSNIATSNSSSTLKSGAPPSQVTPQTIGSSTTPGGVWGSKSKSWASIVGKQSNSPQTTQTIISQVESSKVIGGVATSDVFEMSSTGDNALDVQRRNTQLRDLAEQLSKWHLNQDPVSIQPRGLVNQANWCYMHAPLQALLGCPGFYNLFRSLRLFPSLSRDLSPSPISDSMIQLVREFQPYPKTPSPAPLPDVKSKKKRPSKQELLHGDPFRPDFLYSMLHKIKSSLSYKAFAKAFKSTPDDLDMHIVYDVSHNIAKFEEHIVDGKERTLLVHRKGSTRAFPPHHPLIPVDYQLTGQPVLIGGTMGTCSYVLTGTSKGLQETFGSTCHGAGRALSRAKSRRTLDYQEVLGALKEKGIAIRVASPKLVMEEAPQSYKNVTDVVDTCHAAGISKKAIKLRPIAVIKG